MPDCFGTSSIGALAVLAALGVGPAAAQDFSAGKTAAQLFQSDCTACHRSPAGLARGMDSRSLTAFLREHYTTKEESAAALAAYLRGAGPGPAERAKGTESKPRPPARAAAPGAPKPKAAAHSAEGEAEAGPEAAREPPRRAARAPAREGAHAETEETIRKLNSYAAAGGDARATERKADPAKELESYAGAGSPADALTPAEEATKPKVPPKKKKNAASASAAPAPTAPAASAHPPAPRRPPAAVIQRPPGNN